MFCPLFSATAPNSFITAGKKYRTQDVKFKNIKLHVFVNNRTKVMVLYNSMAHPQQWALHCVNWNRCHESIEGKVSSYVEQILICNILILSLPFVGLFLLEFKMKIAFKILTQGEIPHLFYKSSTIISSYCYLVAKNSRTSFLRAWGRRIIEQPTPKGTSKEYQIQYFTEEASIR